MTGSRDRLVRRIHNRLESLKPMDESARPTSREAAELGARVQRLHEMNDRFSSVRLSQYVACGGVAFVPARIGGQWVTTEV